MIRFLRAVIATLKTASAHMRDGYAETTNQLSHGMAIGVSGTLALIWGGVPLMLAHWIVGAGYLIGWEWRVQRGRDWRDSLQDAAAVTIGGAVAAGAVHDVATGLAVCGLWAPLLARGWWVRWKRQGAEHE